MEEITKTYFAAANSYRGFISYFDKIFPVAEFDRMFILKGGPGTGKSSLMRSISGKLKVDGFDIEHILCSSDPDSLDGVIAKKDEKKIAVIDGTSPHERDAIFPGAVDEIVNLGSNWDERWLRGKRSEIISLNEKKKSAYKTAYNYLRVAGECSSLIRQTEEGAFDKYKAKYEAESLLSEFLIADDGGISTRLISSFGRSGDHRIKLSNDEYNKVVSVGKNDDLFIKICADLLVSSGVNITLFPSAKDPEKLDAIILNKHNILIQATEESDADVCGLTKIQPVEYEKIRLASELHRELLIESARWFKIASEIHFELEKIYSSAMDFTKNDAILSEIYAKICIIYENN
jgi:hypothetical protein